MKISAHRAVENGVSSGAGVPLDLRVIPSALRCSRGEMASKPFACQPSRFVECAGLFEKVRGSGNNDELLFATKLRERRSVQRNDRLIIAADDK